MNDPYISSHPKTAMNLCWWGEGGVFTTILKTTCVFVWCFFSMKPLPATFKEAKWTKLTPTLFDIHLSLRICRSVAELGVFLRYVFFITSLMFPPPSHEVSMVLQESLQFVSSEKWWIQSTMIYSTNKVNSPKNHQQYCNSYRAGHLSLLIHTNTSLISAPRVETLTWQQRHNQKKTRFPPRLPESI